MFVVCGEPHAHCFCVVGRSIFDQRDFALRPESRFAKEMAVVCSRTMHLATAVTREVTATVPDRQTITSKVTRSSPHIELLPL